jgi:hypothetical protein
MPDLPTHDRKAPARRGRPTQTREGYRALRPAYPMVPELHPVEEELVAPGRRGCPDPDKIVLLAMGLIAEASVSGSGDESGWPGLDPVEAAAIRSHLGLPPEHADATIGRDEPRPGCPDCRMEYGALRMAFDECFRDPFAPRQQRPEIPPTR